MILGEGVESADFDFNTLEPVIGFAAEFHSTTTDDGLQIKVNGVEIDLHEFYPDDGQDGDGFLGVFDARGIASFTFVTDSQSEPDVILEEFEMDDVQFAVTDLPVARCQNLEVSADGNCQGVVTPQDIDNGSFDPEDGAITLSLNPPGPYPLGATTVILTVTDEEGLSNTCTATVTVEDDTAPLITVLGDNPQMIECSTPYVESGALARSFGPGLL